MDAQETFEMKEPVSSVEKVVDSAVFKLLFRVGVPILIGLVSWLAGSQLNDIKDNVNSATKDISAIKVSTQKISDDTVANTTSLQNLGTTMNARLNAQDERLRTQDARIDKIDERLRNVEITTAKGHR